MRDREVQRARSSSGRVIHKKRNHPYLVPGISVYLVSFMLGVISVVTTSTKQFLSSSFGPSKVIRTFLTQTAMINFAKGHPNRQLLPVQEMQEIFHKVALANHEEGLAGSLNYPRSDPGHVGLLQELQSFLDRHTQQDDLGSQKIHASSPTMLHFFMTHGVSHGLDMLCMTQTKPGDRVWMERPTYFLAAGIFQSHRLQIQSLPMNERGVDLDRLEQSLENGDVSPPRMIYIIPTHQNPTARVMSIDDRWRLVKLARRYGILVVADEVYHLLDWRDITRDGPRPARMAVLDSRMGESETSTDGCCVSVSSFTKTFAPGVRCGWIEGPKSIIDSIENLGYIRSQGGCTPMVGELMRISLSEGISDRVLANLNLAYRERSARLCQIISSDDGIIFDTEPLGGYFTWVSFDGIDNTGDFLTFCSDRGVRFLPGERCDVSGPQENHYPNDQRTDCRRWARFCFADLDMDELETGAKLIVQCYREYLKMEEK